MWFNVPENLSSPLLSKMTSRLAVVMLCAESFMPFHCEMAILLILMQRRLSGLDGKFVFAGLVKSLIGIGGMWFGLYVWIISTTMFSIWVISLGGIIVGGTIYVGLLYLLKTEEIKIGINFLKSKVESYI